MYDYLVVGSGLYLSLIHILFLSKRTGTVKKTYPDFIESGTDHRKPEAA